MKKCLKCNKTFEDEKKFTHGALFDSPEALNLAAKNERKKQTLKKEKEDGKYL